ncbi:MAG: NADH-quinone oxidoreductase subunit N [Candidatus Acidiferrales bacterium]|jgi:NADH-quinone oxidoreductase subunit N
MTTLYNLLRHIQASFPVDLHLIMPEIMLVLFGLGILLIDLWEDAQSKALNAVMALVGVIFSGYSLWELYVRVPAYGPQLGFRNTIVVDQFFLFFGLIFLTATALVILLSARYMQIEEEDHGEYYALMLFATAGMMFMAAGIDLIVQFLGLETMAISFYVLTGFLRRERRSNEAALKYLLLGAFSSGILAYGFSLLYGMGRSTNIGEIAQALAIRRAGPLAGQADWLLMAAFVTIAAGLFFKVAAAPFHQWAPDVYEGAPTTITAYVSVASMTASFALLLRLFLVVFGPSHAMWTMLVAAVAVASMTIGNFAALTQTNIKRLLAYSSIAHVGYLLLGVVAFNAAGFVGIMYYLFAYAFMTVGAFAVVIVLRRKGIIGDELEDLNGLYQRSPVAAVLLLIFMLSLAGIPPTAGFMGKYFIFQALIMSRHYTLAVFAALYILPGLYYYFRIVVHAWMREPGARPKPAISLAQAVALTVAVFVTLAAGIYPEPFTQLALYAIGR